jgi:beta-lactamase regulating signal transducer with metallopeptidase domain
LLTGALATKLLCEVWQARRLFARHCPIAEPHIRACLDEAAARLGLGVAPALGAAAIRSPVVWCWGRRPTVLVPASAGVADASVDWVGVFCHELAHFRRADHITDILAQLVTVLLPWQPLAWWARRRLHELSEQACDVWAIADGRSPLVYAESLLRLRSQRRPGLAMAAVSSRSLLVARVERLLRLQPCNPRAGGAWIATTWAACVLAAVGVALAQSAAPQATTARTEQDGDHAGAAARMTVSGLVKLSNGNAAAGAKVAVVGRPKRPTRGGDLAAGEPEVLGLTATDEQGRFRTRCPARFLG